LLGLRIASIRSWWMRSWRRAKRCDHVGVLIIFLNALSIYMSLVDSMFFSSLNSNHRILWLVFVNGFQKRKIDKYLFRKEIIFRQ
jgi:hypothetical protein